MRRSVKAGEIYSLCNLGQSNEHSRRNIKRTVFILEFMGVLYHSNSTGNDFLEDYTSHTEASLGLAFNCSQNCLKIQ